KPMQTRRQTKWKAAICFGWVLVLAAGLSAQNRTFLTGGDISMLSRLEETGVVFKDDGQPKDLIKLMGDYGANCFRLRLFVEPSGRGGVIQDVPYTINLAKRIKAAGAVFLLDFHYSDTWADPSHQSKPKAWENLSFADLTRQVQLYSADVIRQLTQAGVQPDMVQIGNEIAPGFLWPDGKLSGKEPEAEWQRFTTLLKAGIAGVKQADPNETIQIVIHIECGGDAKKTDWFFSHLDQYGVAYDIIGLSYYPWWHGTLADLRTNLTQTAERFKKPVFVVETAYFNQPFDPGRGTFKDNLAWEKSPAGQQAFLCDVVQSVRDVPDGMGMGVLWWYPESVPIRQSGGWNNGATALFDSNGRPLPALSCFQPPAGK
ncbi:MAG TPA: glycosyl hydrolase 53 family protein, partial [Anaerohalosphaeraceae bacterium]|nr:glycosyl hydrolase 53 family protein [Anaerohalosphaeraceae bacterium]